jgi:transposase
MAEAVSGSSIEPDFAAFVGIDWADQKHCWKLVVADTKTTENGELQQTPEELSRWVAALHHRFGGRPIAVALEQSSGALVYQLSQYPHLWLYPVHPATAAHYRQAFYPSGSKSDPADAGLLLELVVHHRHRLRRLAPDTSETRLLRMLVEQRRQLVDEKTRWNNRLTAALKMYFPQVLDWVDVDRGMGCDLLERWPTLQQLQHAHPGTLRKFFHEHNCRCEQLITARIEAIYQAVPAVQDSALLEGESAIAASCVAQIRALLASITRLDHQIELVSSKHPESPLFAELPGAGAALQPRLIAAFGTQRDRYANASELQAYSGIAPVTESSGHSRWVHVRWACPTFLRQTFHEFAACSISRSEWARVFYDTKIAAGKSHHAAVRALAYKWIRVLFRCWKDSRPYDEQTYLQALAKRNSPFKLAGQSSTKLVWKTVGEETSSP